MKKVLAILFSIVTLMMISGCQKQHQGDGYCIQVPRNYNYEKKSADDRVEEIWEHNKYNDAKVRVTIYPNSDTLTAKTKFFNDNGDYQIDDKTASSTYGIKANGDSMYFSLWEVNGTVYIVSWEYSFFADLDLRTELEKIAESFTLSK